MSPQPASGAGWSRNNAVWTSSQTKLSNVRNNLGSSLSWLRFENPDVPNHKSVAPDRAHPGQNESRCLKKCSPLTLATFSTAGNSKHVRSEERRVGKEG